MDAHAARHLAMRRTAELSVILDRIETYANQGYVQFVTTECLSDATIENLRKLGYTVKCPGWFRPNFRISW
mgnify:FL=1